MKRVIIVGGGISGLVCSHVFSRYIGAKIVIMEPGEIGGEYLAGGLKYVRSTNETREMLENYGLAYSDYQVRGGIMLRGEVYPYPGCFETMSKEAAKRIQDDHYRKTRMIEPGVHSAKAMNDPAARGPRTALRCDFEELVEALSRNVAISQERVQSIIGAANYLWTDRGNVYKYDYLVLTIPLWVIKKCADWRVPHAIAMKLNIVNVIGPRRDKYAPWDYIYTPYTPGNAIHRFSSSSAGEVYSMEANGEFNTDNIHSDLNFIFPNGWEIKEVKQGLKGHIIPLSDGKPDWPDNVAPLGRYAKWDSRATIDVTIKDAEALARRWLG